MDILEGEEQLLRSLHILPMNLSFISITKEMLGNLKQKNDMVRSF